MLTPERHREISAQFLEHAEAELESGDSLQASEKAWGAVAHCVHAIVRQRGREVKSHAGLEAEIMALIKREPGRHVHRRRLYDSVYRLHTNFYRDELSEGDVRQRIEDAAELVKALEELNVMEESTQCQK